MRLRTLTVHFVVRSDTHDQRKRYLVQWLGGGGETGTRNRVRGLLNLAVFGRLVLFRRTGKEKELCF